MTQANDPASGTLLKHVRKRLWIVAVCVLIGAGYSYHHAHSAPQTYEASAQLLFGANSVMPVIGLPAGSSSNNANAGATNASLAALPIISTDTARALGKRLPPGGVDVSTESVGTTNFVQVTARSPSAKGAALVATAYAYQFVYYMQQQQHAQFEQAIKAVRQQLSAAQGRTLQTASLNTDLDNLELAAAVNPVPVQVAQGASVPLAPVSKKVGTKTIEGAVLGGIVGVIIALLLAWVDPKLRDLSDIDLRGLRVVRPPGRRLKEGTDLSTVLARRILGESHVDPRLVAITSPGAAADVKAAQQVAIALAQAAAASGLTVAILSATRRSVGEAEDAETVEPASTDSLPRTQLAEGVEQLRVPADALVRGTVAADIEADLRASYGLVIVMEDSPSEFSPFARLVRAADVSVLVVTLGRTNRARAESSARSLVRIASGPALMFACPAGFRAKLQKELTLQPVG